MKVDRLKLPFVCSPLTELLVKTDYIAISSVEMSGQ